MEENVVKAYQILAVIHDQRQVCVELATIARELAYIFFVWPHLEYASIVWSPWQCYLEDTLEKA